MAQYHVSGQTRSIGTALDTVGRAWDAFIGLDIDGVVVEMSSDIQTDMTNFYGWLDDRVYSGHEGFRRFIALWLEGWERYEAGLSEIVEVVPGCVLCLSWQRAFGADSHVPVEMELAQIVTVNDKGQITRMELWSDREAARAEALRR